MKAITELGISPTPWHVNQGQSSDDMWCEVRGKEVGDIVCDCMIGHGYEQIRANARLIAAAPMLYEALRGLVKVTLDTYWDRYWRGCEVAKERVNEAVEKAKAALAAASGEREEGGAK